MKLPPGEWSARADLAHLAEALGAGEGAVRLVGGAVRDTLLGLPVADIDLATRHLPEEAMRRIGAAGFRAVPTGLAHGTVTAVLPSGPVEVTTLRRDLATDGRHATVAFTDDWQADAARRDFTINALFADPRDGTIDDYFGGLDDLGAGRVRFIGDPLQRIAEDHLRILRFFRFHARFGRRAPDAAGLAACAARAGDLRALSVERIAAELLKLLAVADPAPTIAAMGERAILAPVLPEIDAGAPARLARLIAREAAIGDPDPIRRLAALLPGSPADAEAVAARLKLSTAQRRRLARAADPDLSPPPRALAHAIGLEAARDRLLLHGDDAAMAAGMAAFAGWQVPRLPIGGGALVAMGMAKGPAVAATLSAIERRWVAENFPPEARVRAIAAEEVARATGGAPPPG